MSWSKRFVHERASIERNIVIGLRVEPNIRIADADANTNLPGPSSASLRRLCKSNSYDVVGHQVGLGREDLGLGQTISIDERRRTRPEILHIVPVLVLHIPSVSHSHCECLCLQQIITFPMAQWTREMTFESNAIELGGNWLGLVARQMVNGVSDTSTYPNFR